MTWTFRGIATSLDPRRLIHSDVAFTRLRRTMVEELGMDARRADRVLEEMVMRALTRYGDDFVRGKSAILDRVVELRERLDGLYHEVLNFDGRVGRRSTARVQAAGRPSIRDQLRDIDNLITQLDDELARLRQPLDEMRPDRASTHDVARETADEIARSGRSARRPGHEHRDVLADTVREAGRRRSRLARKGFRPHPPGQDRTFLRRFADGSTALFSIENGIYRVVTRDASGHESVFHEFDVLSSPYGRRPLTTSLMQAHHGLQNSLMTRLFGRFGYAGDAAPTVWLRNSRAGSPHGAITAVQNSARSARQVAATTLSEIRRLAIEDLRLTHMPEERINEYLLTFDRYFETAVLPNIPANQRARLLGNWRPSAGAAL